MRIINTEQGAWWETLFGTDPSKNRLAPVMPLLPTTIRSAPCSSATSRIASAGSPWRGYTLHRDPGLASHLGSRLQRRVHVLARADRPLQILWRVAALLAQALSRHRLIRAHQLERCAHGLGEVNCLAYGLAGGVRAVGSNHDRSEHDPPLASVRAALRLKCEPIISTGARQRKQSARLSLGAS